MNLWVGIGDRKEQMRFNIVNRLGTEVIIGCDDMDKTIEEIRPRRGVVEMAVVDIVHIVRQTLGRYVNNNLLKE